MAVTVDDVAKIRENRVGSTSITLNSGNILPGDVAKVRREIEADRVGNPNRRTLELDPELYTVRTGIGTGPRTIRQKDTSFVGLLYNNPVTSDFMDLLFPDPANDRTFAEYNTWLEQDDNQNLIEQVRRVQHGQDTGGTFGLADVAASNDQGWTLAQLEDAQRRLEEYEQLPGWYRLLHRPDMSATGIGQQAVGGAALTAAATAQGLADLVQGRQTNLEDAEGIAGGLYQMGRDTYDSGAAAQQTARLGLTDGQETIYNLAEMTGENLAMGLINPSLLLMEMSARSAGEGVVSMTDQDRSAGAAALSGLGHGAISYAIEQAGIAQMMKNLGLPSGMSRAADALVDRIGSLPGVGTLSPWLFGTLASAGEEGLEEFTQTYADAALDQLLGAGGPGLLSGELLGEAAQSAVMGAAGGGILGALSGGIGQIRQGGFITDTDPVRLAQQEQATQEAQQQEQTTQAEEAPAPQTPASAALSAQLDALQQATDPEAPAVPADPQLLTPQTAAASDPQTAADAPLAESMETPSQSAAEAPAAANYGWAEEIGRQAAEAGRLDEAAWEQLRQNAATRTAQAAQRTAETITQAQAAQLKADSRSVQIDSRWSTAQRQEARLLAENSSLSADAVELVVDAMPGGVSPEIYTDAARQIYQIARQGIATEEADALDLAQRFGVKVGQVMAVPGGPEALHQVWNQGRIEGLAATGYGQAGFAPEKTAGTVTVEPGAQLPAEDLQLIDLAARATDTAVTIKDRLENGAGGAIDTALGKIYFAAEQGQDTLGAVLHEELHLYNALDPEGGRQLQQTALRYLAESQGFESVDRLIVNYVEQLQQAGQEITYSQAAEELVADAMRGVFSDVKSFVRWVKSQKAQAAKNAESRGIISKTMDAVKKLLNQIIQKAKTILAREPDNQAARWAQSLAEEQRQELERLWYQHQDTALDNQRTMRDAGTKAADTKSTDTQSLEERYHLPIEPGSAESGKRAAAWENIDRGEVEAALAEAYEGKNLRQVPVENIINLARRLLKESGSKTNQIVVAKKLENLLNYLSSGKADPNVVWEILDDISETIMEGSVYRDDTLYKQYPDLHGKITFYLKKGSPEYQEILYRYGKLGTAQEELKRFGVELTSGESHKNSSIDLVYESLSRDHPELFPAEITDPMARIDATAAAKEAIGVKYRNSYGENWDEAKADLSMRILGAAVAEGVTDTGPSIMLQQRIDENLNRHRANIRERVTANLDRMERSIRVDATQNAQRIVNEAGKINQARAERDQKRIQELEESKKRRAEAWAKSSANLRLALAQSRDTTRRARDARNKDALRRSISSISTRLDRMARHPKPDSHIPAKLYKDFIAYSKIAFRAVNNQDAYDRILKLETEMNEMVSASGTAEGIAADWENGGIKNLMENIRMSFAQGMDTSQYDQQRDAAANAIDRGLDVLQSYEGQQNGMPNSEEFGMQNMSIEQLQMILDLGSALLTIAKNENKLLSIQSSQNAAEMSAAARQEVSTSAVRRKKEGSLVEQGWEFFNENLLNAPDFFLRLGGYRKGRAMDTLGQILSNGEARMNAIKAEGLRPFQVLLEDEKNIKDFSGSNAKLVDLNEIGFKVLGEAKINRGQMVTLWLSLQNPQNLNHIINGGIVIPNMEQMAKGNIEEAQRTGVLVKVAKDPETFERSLVNLEAALNEYDQEWIAKAKTLLNEFCPRYINNTSVSMYGFEKARVKNYIPIVSARDYIRPNNLEGLKYNGTIEGRGFLKERREIAKNPIVLEDITSIINRSLSDTAAYAGLAPALRDANMVWNSGANKGQSLRAVVSNKFGEGAVKYVEQYITDLQNKPLERKSLVSVLGSLRGLYAGAVLGLNPSVALGQYSGIFNAGAELGTGRAMKDAVSYMTRRTPGVFLKKNDAWLQEAERIDAEMVDFGYMGLEAIKSGGATAELEALRNGKTLVQRGIQKLPEGVQSLAEKLPEINWMEDMDLETRRGCWIGAKTFVEENLSVYNLSQEDLDSKSDRYKAAVTAKMTAVINNTQPNYSISQRAAIQRNPGQLEKTLTMFKTQGLRNYGLMLTSIERVRSLQKYETELTSRLKDGHLEPDHRQQLQTELDWVKEQVPQAQTALKNSAGSVLISTAVYSAIVMLVKDVLLHRLDRDKDENGNFTILSVGKRYLGVYGDSMAGNVLFLPEALSVAGNLFGFRSDDPVSLTGIDAIGDFAADLYALEQSIANDPDPVKILGRFVDLAGSTGALVGLPIGQVTRMGEALLGWAQDITTAAINADISMADLMTAPESSSSQYDRLYAAAFENADPDEVEAALGKLDQLDRITPPAKAGDEKAGDKKILSEMMSREKAYGDTLSAAAAARIEGREQEYQQAFQALVNRLAAALGIDPDNPGSDRPRLNAVIDKASSAISDEVKRQLGQDSETGATIYDKVFAALDAGGNVRAELEALRRAGIQDDAIRSAVSGRYKQTYIDADEAGRDDIAAQLLRLVDAEGEPYYTRKEMDGWASDAALKGFNESVYTDLDEALQTRNLVSAQEQIDRYLAAGKSDGSIRDRIVALYKETYLAAQGSERTELGKFLCRLKGSRGTLISPDTLTGWIKDAAKDKAR